MAINIKEFRQELTNPSIEQMSHQELIEEKARLERSQGGNPNEEPWSPELFKKLEQVKKALQENTHSKKTDAEVDRMSHQQLIDEQARLEKSQGGNPEEEPWSPKRFKRLEKIRNRLKTL